MYIYEISNVNMNEISFSGLKYIFIELSTWHFDAS